MTLKRCVLLLAVLLFGLAHCMQARTLRPGTPEFEQELARMKQSGESTNNKDDRSRKRNVLRRTSDDL